MTMEMKCPVCGSHNTAPDFDTCASVDDGGAVILMDCHHCGSDWFAVFNFSHNEEIYDATNREEDA